MGLSELFAHVAAALFDFPIPEVEIRAMRSRIPYPDTRPTLEPSSSTPSSSTNLIPHILHFYTHTQLTMSYRRVDASDPRRPERVRPLALPASWKADELDLYASFLGSISMISGAAMLTRAPYIAYAGMVFACAHIAHDKPFKSSRTREASTGGPWMSLL